MNLKSPVNLNNSLIDGLSHFETIFAASLQTALNHHIRAQLSFFANKDCLEIMTLQIDDIDLPSLMGITESFTVRHFLETTSLNSFKSLFNQPANFIDVFIGDYDEIIRVSNGMVFISKCYFQTSCSKFEFHKLFNEVLNCTDAKFIKNVSDDNAQLMFSRFISSDSSVNPLAINHHLNSTLAHYFKTVVFHNVSWCVFNTDKTVSINQEWLDVLDKIGMSKAVFARVFQNANKVDLNQKLTMFKSTKGLSNDSQIFKTLLKIGGLSNDYKMDFAA